MADIFPTITAQEPHAYREQIERISHFTNHVHIDLMDGRFAPTVSPSIDQVWWPDGMQAAIHLMYMRPMEYINELIKLKPRLVIIHNEADVHHMHFAALLHRAGIKAGLALLRDTPPEYAYQIMHSFDHILIFSGHLGYQGGSADLSLLDKVTKLRAEHPEVEIGWDGGVSVDNASQLVRGGVDILNVGGAIHRAKDPSEVYATLKATISGL